MNFDSYEATLNLTQEVVSLQLENFINFVHNSVDKIKGDLKLFADDWVPSPIEFTPLQQTLLKLLLILIFGTGSLIAYYWLIYGKVITEKFVKPSTLKEIEELKSSVAKLKLPKDHSPRI